MRATAYQLARELAQLTIIGLALFALPIAVAGAAGAVVVFLAGLFIILPLVLLYEITPARRRARGRELALPVAQSRSSRPPTEASPPMVITPQREVCCPACAELVPRARRCRWCAADL